MTSDHPKIQDKEFLRKFKKPIRANCARGREYLDYPDAVRIGAAIEKRARKALKRQQRRTPTTEE